MNYTKILFIDDELNRLDPFIDDVRIEAKERNIDAIIFEAIDNLEEAYKYIVKNIETIDLVVLDIMMPGGDKFYNQKEDPMGLRCGFYFYLSIREEFPSLKIIVFTNISDSGISSSLSKDSHGMLLFKDEVLPFELTDIILNSWEMNNHEN